MNEEFEKAPDALARLVRDLPPRRAPASLEARVAAELHRRTTLAGWRRGFAFWPVAAQAGFLLLCFGTVGLLILDGSWGLAAGRVWGHAAAMSAPWTHPATATVESLGFLSSLLLRLVPATWVYGAAATCAALYLALFALGVTAYRSLYRQPSRIGQSS